MIVKSPTKEEFELSNTLRHFVWSKELLSGGKQQLKEIADLLEYDKKYPWAYEPIFGKFSNWLSLYPEEYKAASTGQHRQDKRTPAVFALDLYTNWIVEDYIVYLLMNKLGFNIRLNGVDKNRRIKCKAVNNQSDMMICCKNSDLWFPLELSISYTQFIKKFNMFHLRDDKYEHLKEEKSILLQIELLSHFFLLFSPYYDESRFNIKIIDNFKPFGGKKADEIQIKNSSDIIDISLMSKTIETTLERLKNLQEKPEERQTTQQETEYIAQSNEETEEYEMTDSTITFA